MGCFQPLIRREKKKKKERKSEAIGSYTQTQRGRRKMSMPCHSSSWYKTALRQRCERAVWDHVPSVP